MGWADPKCSWATAPGLEASTAVGPLSTGQMWCGMGALDPGSRA